MGGTKLKYPSIFSDNPDERKLALDRMSRQGEETQIQTMKITEEVEALHEHVLEKWRQGTQIYDPFSHKFNQAALKLQRMGRAWLTRKIVREGKFLRDGMKAWLSANLNTAFSSRLAAIQLSEVLKMFKIFGVCPEVVHPPDILRASLEIIQASDSGKVLDSNKPRMSLTWTEFQALCWRLSFKMGEIKPDCVDELDGLIRVDDLLRMILEGKAEQFDPKRAADWIRQRMLDFAEIQHRDHLSGGPKGKSPLGSPGRIRSLGRLRPPHPDLDVSSVYNQKVPQSTNRFHRAPKSKLESRSERRFERARSVASEGESMTQRERSSKSGSVGGPTQSGDGVGAYVSMCVQLDEEPVPTIQHQLHSSILNLSHYRLKMEQIKALAVGLEKSKCITRVVMIDAGLSSSQAWGILFTAFRLNSAITHVDLSENDGFDKHSVVALSEFLAKTSTLQHLTLRGLGMTDEAFDKIVRDGIEQNHHKCPKHLDLAYNMLTDTSLENLEYLVLERAGLSAMDLSWNMLSAKAVKKLDLATHQRSKPRSLRREGGNFKKSLEPIALHLEDNQQRFSLMYAHGANGIPRWTPESKGLLSRADYITLCVALSATHTFITSQNQMPFFKFRLIRLMTSGWNLSPEMIAEQLRAHFANVHSVLQGMAVDMLLKKLASSDEIFQLTTLLEDHAAIYVDFVHQHLRALASGSPLEREKSMRSSIGGDF